MRLHRIVVCLAVALLVLGGVASANTLYLRTEQAALHPAEEDEEGHPFDPATTGGCPAPKGTPKDVLDSMQFQRELWRLSVRTYPQCTIPKGAAARAFAQLRAMPHSHQGTSPAGGSTAAPETATSATPASSGTIGDGLGESAWSAVGPVGISNGWAGVDSGRVSALAADPTNSQVVYAGAAGGGVWKTTDGGATWTPLTSNQASESVGAIAIDPSNHNTIYVGTGEGDNSGDSLFGAGILKSTDGGSTWTLLGASVFTGLYTYKIAVDPVTPSKLWVATNQGLFVSTDGGSSWSNPNLGGTWCMTANDVIVDPNDHNTVYAAIQGCSTSSGASTATGIYKTTDGGTTWTMLPNAPNGNATLPGGNSLTGRTRLALANVAGGPILYAAVANANTSAMLGFYKTTDGGSTWTQLTNSDPPSSPTAGGPYWYCFGMAVDPNDPTGQTVWIAGTDAFKTSDGGKTWTNETQVYSGNPKHVHPDQHAFAFAGTTMYLGSDGGVATTTDGGATFVERNDTLDTAQFYKVAADTSISPVVIGGSQDTGTLCSACGSTGGRWNEVYGGDGGAVAVDFTNPSVMYEEYVNLDIHKSTNAGSSWTSITSGITDRSSACFIAPFIMSPADPQVLLAGTKEVYETTNGGASWTVKSGDLTAGGGCIQSLAYAPSAPTTYYAGTTSGKVWVTTNDGVSWTDISVPSSLGSAATMGTSSIAVDPTNPAIVYLTKGGYSSGAVFRSANGGASWQNISGNLPLYPNNSIVVDPLDPAHLYLGTDQGIFESTNLGTTWTQLMSGLPTVEVDSLYLNRSGTVLVAGTHGRGVYVLHRSWARLTNSSGAPIQSAAAGTSVTVTGNGFQPGEAVSMSMVNSAGQSTAVGTGAVADSSGSIATTFTVPSGLAAGTYQFHLKGNSSLRDSSQPLTIPGAPLLIGTTSLPRGQINSEYYVPLQATGGTPPYTWSVTGGTPPAGITLSSGGIISGVSTAPASTNLTVQISDSAHVATTASFSLVITGPPPVVPAGIPSAEAGTPYTITLTASGGTAPYVWSLASGALPAGLTIGTDGTISGTPTAAGSSSFTLQVTDATQATTSQPYTLTVIPAVQITTTSLPAGEPAFAYSATLQASGGLPSYYWGLYSGSLPAGLTLNQDGTITGTPSATGTASFTAYVEDGMGGMTTRNLTLTIVPPPQIQIATGWNLIDLPTQGSGITSASQLVNAVNGAAGTNAAAIIATYSNGRFNLYVPNYSQDLPLGPTQGIFVKSTSAGTWTPGGGVYLTGQQIALQRGWNLVAAPFPVAGLDAGGIATQATGCGVQEVADYVGGSYQTWTPGSSTSLNIPSNSGMWVLCSSAGSWAPAG